MPQWNPSKLSACAPEPLTTLEASSLYSGDGGKGRPERLTQFCLAGRKRVQNLLKAQPLQTGRSPGGCGPSLPACVQALSRAFDHGPTLFTIRLPRPCEVSSPALDSRDGLASRLLHSGRKGALSWY